jgi:hypothetical protein
MQGVDEQQFLASMEEKNASREEEKVQEEKLRIQVRRGTQVHRS